MSVSPDDVRHVARLARVGLDDAHIPTLVGELNGILRHMDVLQRVDITDVPLTPSEQAAPWRDDARPADVLRRPRETFAPAARDGFFLVPRLGTHEESGAAADVGEGGA